MNNLKFEIKKELNDSQYKAVKTIYGPVLVIAGAGSGKTRVIEYRVLNLLQNGIIPNSILLLTFTRRAAHEMISRAAKHNQNCIRVEGGTFHSFGYKMLKKYAKSIGLPNSFSILDEGDAEEAIHRCCTKEGYFEIDKRFPKKDTLRKIISMSINKNVSIEDVLIKEYPDFIEFSSKVENLRKIYTEYKLNRNYLDYDDLLMLLKILLENEKLRTRLSKKYKYIMVDEYQDTNQLQGEITYLLSKIHKNVMVVGDDAQSIYGFRGSSHKNIMKFPELFPECKKVKLEDNYRSTQLILDLANSVLKNMKNKYSKCLVSKREGNGNKSQLLFFKNNYEEAEWIAKKIKSLRDEGIDFCNQSVLFRSSYISISLQLELIKRNIPFQFYGGKKFNETAHVKDVIAHLKIIVNPKDELSWNRLLMLIKGIGPKTSDHITEEIMSYTSLNIIIDVFNKYKNSYRYSEGITRLISLLKHINNENLTVGEKYENILNYYKPILKNKFDDWHKRLNDLETLIQITSRYKSLEDLLVDFALEPPEKSVSRVDPSTPNNEKPLILSTIHQGKGLEWDTVFLIGLIDGILPSKYSLNEEDEIEEEHRLFYVAITRAKNNLFLTVPHEGVQVGIQQFNKLSRFIDKNNILENLEKVQINKPISISKEPIDENIEVRPFYDKKSLLNKIIDFFK